MGIFESYLAHNMGIFESYLAHNKSGVMSRTGLSHVSHATSLGGSFSALHAICERCLGVMYRMQQVLPPL